MAFAEARAAWQRTVNRCLVQEDAKRAPKLACCSSIPPSAKQNDAEVAGTPGGQEMPTTVSLPDWNPSSSNLSPNSRWWIQLQPNHGYHKGLMDVNFNSAEPDTGTCQIDDTSEICAKNEVNYVSVNRSYTLVEDSPDAQCKAFIACEKEDFNHRNEAMNCQDPRLIETEKVVKKVRDEGLDSFPADKIYNSDLPCIDTEKTALWWQTADSEELALLIAQRSRNLVHNCDLPKPQNTCVNKDLNFCVYNGSPFSSLDPKSDALNYPSLSPRNYTLGSRAVGSACQNLRLSAECHLISSEDKLWRDGTTHKQMFERNTSESVARNARLLEALRHSQTRAREADKAAKQALEEKEHILKLVLRQASVLFAYKQWLQLLQLENMYFPFKSNKSHSISDAFPVALPSRRSSKMRKIKRKPAHKEPVKQFCLPRIHFGRYVIFALGLGLIGAGLLLGWTIGQFLPTW